MTFANFLRKKYAVYCILQCAVTHLGVHKVELQHRAKHHVSDFFSQNITAKCPDLPRSNFEVTVSPAMSGETVAALEITKNGIQLPPHLCFFPLFYFNECLCEKVSPPYLAQT
jgi:hypothetical protein